MTTTASKITPSPGYARLIFAVMVSLLLPPIVAVPWLESVSPSAFFKVALWNFTSHVPVPVAVPLIVNVELKAA